MELEELEDLFEDLDASAPSKEQLFRIYGIYLPLLDGACMIPDDARICRKTETVDGEEINGHLIETVPIKRSTLGMCLGVEDNAGMPVFSGDYIKVKTASVVKSICGLDAAVQDGILLAEETDRGFLLFDGETFSINALQFLHRLQESGGEFTVCGNIYDNPELTPEARKNSIA